MTHPLHPVHTGRDEYDAVLLSGPASEQVCSICKNVLNNGEKPAFQCLPCDFKLCHKCKKGFKHPAHVEHALFWINPIQLHGKTWTCGACNKTSSEIKDTYCYHCGECDFSLCSGCFSSIKHPMHAHALICTDVRYKYHQSFGDWCCDCCGRNNGPLNYFPRHCGTCQFDLCNSCSQPHYTSLHEHALFKSNSLVVYDRFHGGWRCDNCSQSFTPDINKNPYHCQDCEYDLCEKCLKAGKYQARASGACEPTVEQTVPAAYDVSRTEMAAVRGVSRQRIITRTAAGNPVTSPEEDMVETASAVATRDESPMCVICFSKPKDATIVHGGTGHVCCCVGCAHELRRRGAPCPICRAPIDMVIKQFVS